MPTYDPTNGTGPCFTRNFNPIPTLCTTINPLITMDPSPGPRLPLDFDPTTTTSFTAILLLSGIILPLLARPFSNLTIFKARFLTPPHDPNVDASAARGKRDRRVWMMSLLAAGQVVAWGFRCYMLLRTGETAEGTWMDELLGAAGMALAWLYTCLSPLIKPPLTAPFHLLLLSLISTVSSSLVLLSSLLHPTPLSPVPPSLSLLSSLLLTLLLLSYPVSPPPLAPPTCSSSTTGQTSDDIFLASPEETASVRQFMSFEWMGELVRKSRGKTIDYCDLWRLAGTMRSEEVWRSARETRGASILRRAYRNNEFDFFLNLVLGFLRTLLGYGAPFFLNKLLSSLSPPLDGSTSDVDFSRQKQAAYIYVILSLLTDLLKAEVGLLRIWFERRLILRIRSQLITEVYEKALKRRDLGGVVPGSDAPVAMSRTKTRARESKDKGSIFQLMATDVDKVGELLKDLNNILMAPFELLFASVLLYRFLGWSTLVGLSTMALSIFLSEQLVRRRAALDHSTRSARDKTLELLREFISAVKYIKYNDGEEKWLGRVFQAREIELGWSYKARIIDLLMNVVWESTPDVITLLSFVCLTKVLGMELTVPIAFPALFLLARIRAPMKKIPGSLTQFVQTSVSLDRIERFLSEPEVDSWVSTLESSRTSSPTSTDSSPVVPPSTRIGIVNGTFRYEPKSTITSLFSDTSSIVSESTFTTTMAPPFELQDITVEFPVGGLSLVLGSTASGKSSLMLALLGEMECVKGQVFCPKSTRFIDPQTGRNNGGVSYAAQDSFLQNDTVQNNILFGLPLEFGRYEDVLDACALRQDLDALQDGDQTEIGEKGVTLSGGQRARLALARAVYSRAKTVLLDDILSAVDPPTAAHIYHRCLKGPINSHRTIILITHNFPLCFPGADYVVQLASGRVSLQGRPSELDPSLLEFEVPSTHSEDSIDLPHSLDLTSFSIPASLSPSCPTPFASTPYLDLPLNGPFDHARSLASTRDITPSATPAVGQPATNLEGIGKLIQAEARATGNRKAKVYTTYLRAAGIGTWVSILALLAGDRLIRVLDRVWFRIWGESYRPVAEFLKLYYHQSSASSFLLPSLPSASDNVNLYIAGYLVLCVLGVVFVGARILAEYRGSFKATRILFNATLTRISRAPFHYFDSPVMGRITNRFTTDFEQIDQSLSSTVTLCAFRVLTFINNIVLIVLIAPNFLFPAVLLTYVYVTVSISYVHCSRDLGRLEAGVKSVYFSKLDETNRGITTIRAFGVEQQFLRALFDRVDMMLTFNYTRATLNRYVSWRFDCIGAISVAATACFSLLSGASPGQIALAITSAETLIDAVYWLCRESTKLEVRLNSVERVVELLEIPQEPPAIVEGKRPPAFWPSDTGGIVFENVVVGYGPFLPPVLRGISLVIEPGSKIGVCGRTGSGKTTLAQSLFRFNDVSKGRILIDGINIQEIGLSDLRSRLTFITQDATFFAGTVRNNLDPFMEHTDTECQSVLERVGLAHSVPSSPSPSLTGDSTPVIEWETERTIGLDTAVIPEGKNFSGGQKQLLAMARALLRNRRVIVMDEASSKLDLKADDMIQRMIREEFASSLVVTVAHRLGTVIDYDKIIVLDQGELAEFDTPRNLLLKEDGVFRHMCEASSDRVELFAAAGLEYSALS